MPIHLLSFINATLLICLKFNIFFSLPKCSSEMRTYLKALFMPQHQRVEVEIEPGLRTLGLKQNTARILLQLFHFHESFYFCFSSFSFSFFQVFILKNFNYVEYSITKCIFNLLTLTVKNFMMP